MLLKSEHHNRDDTIKMPANWQPIDVSEQVKENVLKFFYELKAGSLSAYEKNHPDLGKFHS